MKESISSKPADCHSLALKKTQSLNLNAVSKSKEYLQFLTKYLRVIYVLARSLQLE